MMIDHPKESLKCDGHYRNLSYATWVQHIINEDDNVGSRSLSI